jgi:hypothetical protein
MKKNNIMVAVKLLFDAVILVANVSTASYKMHICHTNNYTQA